MQINFAVNSSCLSVSVSKGTYQKVLMGTETGLHGDSDIHGACSPSVPQSFQGMTCVDENCDSREDVHGVTHPLKGREPLTVLSSVLYGRVSRQLIWSSTSTGPMNEEFLWGPGKLEVSKWFNTKANYWEMQAKLPALNSFERPFFSSACLWWRGSLRIAGDLGRGWSMSLKPESKCPFNQVLAQYLARQTPEMFLGKEGRVRACGSARGRFGVRTDPGIGQSKVKTRGGGVQMESENMHRFGSLRPNWMEPRVSCPWDRVPEKL